MAGELTAAQRALLDRLSDSELASQFYFTGGAALAAHYLLLQRDDLSLEHGARDCHAKFGWPAVEHLLQTALLRVERIAPDAWPETDPPTSLDEARALLRDRVKGLIELPDGAP